jgi:fluoroquinolone resistance protein
VLEDTESYDGLTLQGERLSDQRLRMVGLRRTRLIDCDLSNAQWERPHLTEVVFERCRLTGFRLSQARGAEVVFTGCQAQYLQLEGCQLKKTRFERCVLTDSTLMRSQLAGALFKESDLSGAVLTGSSLRGGDLRGCRIGGIRAAIADLAGTTLDPEQAAALLLGEAEINVRPLDP